MIFLWEGLGVYVGKCFEGIFYEEEVCSFFQAFDFRNLYRMVGFCVGIIRLYVL